MFQSYKVDFKFVSDIRLGIKECRKLTATYNDKERSLIPLGLIYGEKVFLVAKEDGKGDKIYQYALHKFKDLNKSTARLSLRCYLTANTPILNHCVMPQIQTYPHFYP